MTSAKYKLREMSLNIVDNKEEFDRIFSDKQGNRDNKQRGEVVNQDGEEKIIPRCGYVIERELIPKTRQQPTQLYSTISGDHGYIRTVNPCAAYSINYNITHASKQLLQTLKRKIYPLLLNQPQMVSVLKGEIQNYINTRFKSKQLSSGQVSLGGILDGWQYITNGGNIGGQMVDVIGEVYRDWRMQTSSGMQNFIDKTVNVRNKSFTAMPDSQRPFKTRLKARCNFQLNFLQTTGINQYYGSTSNLIENYHHIKQQHLKQKLQSESFLNRFLYLGKKLGFQIPSQSPSNHIRQSDHSMSLNEEISISSDQLGEKKKRKVRKAKYKRKYHNKEEKTKVRIFYQINQMKQSSKTQVKIGLGSLRDIEDPKPNSKIKIPQQHQIRQDQLRSQNQPPTQENSSKLKDVINNLSQLIAPKESIFSYFSVGYKRKTKTDNNFSSIKKKRVIKIENHLPLKNQATQKVNNTKVYKMNSSFSTCYQHSDDYSIYDSQQQQDERKHITG